MLRIYRAPNGRTYQYEEGEQPWDHVLVEEPKPEPAPEPKPKAKARTTRNKARTTKTKAKTDE